MWVFLTNPGWYRSNNDSYGCLLRPTRFKIFMFFTFLRNTESALTFKIVYKKYFEFYLLPGRSIDDNCSCSYHIAPKISLVYAEFRNMKFKQGILYWLIKCQNLKQLPTFNKLIFMIWLQYTIKLKALDHIECISLSNNVQVL